MDQQYYLKKNGVGFAEQSYMTAEERKWWFAKIEKENEELQRQLKGSKEL